MLFFHIAYTASAYKLLLIAKENRLDADMLFLKIDELGLVEALHGERKNRKLYWKGRYFKDSINGLIFHIPKRRKSMLKYYSRKFNDRSALFSLLYWSLLKIRFIFNFSMKTVCISIARTYIQLWFKEH